MKRKILIVVFLILAAFGSGYAFNSYRLHRCQERNDALLKDLTHAVERGIWVEAHYIRCKEGDK